MKTERARAIEKVPTWALCYMVNGDPQGLSDEDINLVDTCGFQLLTNKGEEYFSGYPAFGLAATVQDWVVEYTE